LGAIATLPVPLILQISNAFPSGADNFADRVPLSGLSGTAVGSNTYAMNGELHEPPHAGKPGGKSVWYTWRSDVTGIGIFGTTNSTFDTLLGIYTGDILSNLTAYASDEDDGGFFTSGVRFNVVKNTDYQIAIDGFGGATGA